MFLLNCNILFDKNVGIIYTSTLSHISENSIKIVKNLIADSEVFSVENNFKIGGLGDLIADTFNIKVKRIGLDRKFITDYGSYDDLRVTANMSRQKILEIING